ncbi:HDOD domain-containing protein [Oxalobacteraceae bacterium]|nr:HDOD domain-containing protein [Oxalobacteraceae bacterium]
MSASEPSLFPLVGFQAVSNAQNEWVALTFELPSDTPDALQASLTLLNYPDVYAALAPLECIIAIPEPLRLEASHLTAMPPNRVILRVAAESVAEAPAQKKCADLAEQGYRIMIDGVAGIAATRAGARALMADCAQVLPPALALLAQPGPHLARNVVNQQRFIACRDAGFSWFMGDYALDPPKEVSASDGTSRKRLLALLGMLARDADSRELEVLLKQDPALSFHLLKLVNSAAFSRGNPIHNFGQAINVLGRRQLQRWLQLLLYARQQEDGSANALLPLAAVRASMMEGLCKLKEGDRDEQDMAFVIGVFSLLDVLLGMPMADIVGALNLDVDVVAALLDRAGAMGELLKLVEGHEQAALDAAGIDGESYWQVQLQAYHWAIQVSRNL